MKRDGIHVIRERSQVLTEVQEGLFLKQQTISYIIPENIKITCQIYFGLLQHVSGLKMYYVSIWIIRGCCCDPQMKAKQKTFLKNFLLLFLLFSCVFPAYMGLNRATAV